MHLSERGTHDWKHFWKTSFDRAFSCSVVTISMAGIVSKCFLLTNFLFLGRSRRRIVLNLPSKADVNRWEDFKRPKTRELKSACGTVRCCDEEESPFFRSLFSYSVLKTLYNALHGLKRDVKSFNNLSNSHSPISTNMFGHFLHIFICS